MTFDKFLETLNNMLTSGPTHSKSGIIRYPLANHLHVAINVHVQSNWPGRKIINILYIKSY